MRRPVRQERSAVLARGKGGAARGRDAAAGAAREERHAARAGWRGGAAATGARLP